MTPPPRGTGDDPFGLGNLAGGLADDKPVRLEGIPPDRFEGDRAKTHQFLTQFKRFMMMNRRSAIARDPLSKSAYFLSLVGGSKADGWAERQYAWLDEVERDPYILPHGMTAWDALEQDFRTSFIDYAVYEKAHEQLRNLKMKDGNIDQFIADFEFLAHRAQVDTDDPTVLHLFKMGIPVHFGSRPPDEFRTVDESCPAAAKELDYQTRRTSPARGRVIECDAVTVT